MPSYRYDLFLSHNGADRAWTQHLAAQIIGDESGPPLHVFVDTWDMAKGSSIPSALVTALDESRRIAFVLSPAAIASDWVAMEMDVAIARRDPSGRNGVLVPLLRADCEIPPQISHLLRIDFRRQRYHEGLRELLDLLRDRRSSQAPGSATSVRQLAEDCDLVVAHRVFFDRAAFWRPCALELSLDELVQAIDGTVAALNTGAGMSREGLLLVRTLPAGSYQTERFITGIRRVKILLADLKALLGEFLEAMIRELPGVRTAAGGRMLLASSRATMSANTFARSVAWMDRVDAARNDVLREMNALLAIAHSQPLTLVELSSSVAGGFHV